ncbi:flagellar hook-length control protein FliK [Pseudomonas sp. BAY1663]|nr:flagellar hook-length control protein FliK [Pseudomonas sp. BAY1663]
MVRLREMFSQQGMNLVDVNVSDQSLARGWQGGGEGQPSRNGFSGETADGDEELRLGVVEVSGNRTSGDRGWWTTTPDWSHRLNGRQAPVPVFRR